MIRKFFIYLLLFNAAGLSVFSQDHYRLTWSVNDHWKYLPAGADFAQRVAFDDAKWELINLPHTWNAQDPFDDNETSRRGISWYRKKIKLDSRFEDKKIYLHFEGANQITDVYVNGVFAGQHKGGYTAFTFDITSLVKLGEKPMENVIALQVNNGMNDFLPPLSIGYASYGGVYRDAWLIATDPLHFSLLDHGSKGIFIATPTVTAEKASVAIKSIISNDAPHERKFEIVHHIYNAQQKEIAQVGKRYVAQASEQLTVTLSIPEIEKPALWSPDHPNLYQVKSQLLENGHIVDEVVNPLGFRWFTFDPDTGFLLNGKKLVLRGTNRHQDFKDRGDALSAADHYRDMKLIKDMGCNFLRLAHYPQSPEILALADKMGILIWEEIPLVNYMNPVPEFLDNSAHMIREMIRQHYNHPSIMTWGSMNEVLLWNEKAERIQTQSNIAYVQQVKDFARKLDSTIRSEDPYRKSTMAMHMSDDYDKFKLSDIPALVGYNIYNGWYSGEVSEFKPTIDAKHRENPKQVLFISEYGAESDNRVNTEKPERLDFTGQYQRLYHESYLSQIRQMPYLAGTAIWSQFDFAQPNVGGVNNNTNQKGMASWDRKPKDVYYLYKANWNPEPMLYIASRDWQTRAGLHGAMSSVEVYSNLDQVTLVVNGKSYGSKRPNDLKKCVWSVPLNAGKNTLNAQGEKNGKRINDYLEIQYRPYPENLKNAPFTEVAVNAGSGAQYLDKADQIWIADRPYKAGSFGYTGGTPAMLSIKTVKKNTDDNPLFYSFLDNVRGYRFDVPDGYYELELCFMENERIAKGSRVFSVAVNGDDMLHDLDLMADCGFGVALRKKWILHIANGQGIQIAFHAKLGKPVLSGIRLKAVN